MFMTDEGDEMTMERFVASGWVMMRPFYLMPDLPPAGTDVPPISREDVTPHSVS